MVWETEGKTISADTIKKSAIILLQNERLGYFYKHICKDPLDKNNSEGTFMITFEYNIYDVCPLVYWF